jgi:hypothetical protein
MGIIKAARHEYKRNWSEIEVVPKPHYNEYCRDIERRMKC